MLYTVFLITAVVGGTVMVCQFLLTMLGLGDSEADFGDADGGDFGADADVGDVDGDQHTSIHHAADADVDHPGSARIFQMFSFRAVVAALTFFGLGGLWASAKGYSPTVAILIASLAGVAALYGMYRLMMVIYGFQSSGNVNIRNAVGKPAKIYIPVPASGAGKGKVQVTVQGRTMEYEAMTDDHEPLATGETVLVEQVVGNSLVKVARGVKEEVEV